MITINFSKIFGRKINFYQLLEEQADFLAEAIGALRSFAETLDPVYAGKVKTLEKEADQKRWELVQGLDSTFITPFDREDVFTLSKALDDVLDYYKTTVSEMEIYRIPSTPELIDFIDMLQSGSSDLRDSVASMKDDSAGSMRNALKAKKCENKVEDIYRSSIAKLLTEDDIKYIIKMREIYRHLSNCADRIDQAADCICNVLMKEIC